MNMPFQGAQVQCCGLAVLRGQVPENNAPNEMPLFGILTELLTCRALSWNGSRMRWRRGSHSLPASNSPSSYNSLLD